MGIKCGIVGLPNVGKSTLFNALTSSNIAQAENYPFCTIEPNIANVEVPDERLNKLGNMASSAKIIHATIEFVDIAGLVKGASKGEGLGNKFLGNIREVDAIIHVVRCFESKSISHVYGNIEPVRDIEIIETELMLADIESLEKRITTVEKKAKTKDEEAMQEFSLMKEALKILHDGKLLYNSKDKDKFQKLQLITSKPTLYVCNVSEEDINKEGNYVKEVNDRAKLYGANIVKLCSKIEQEISNLEDAEKNEYMEALELTEPGLNKVIRGSYNLLGLSSFFTIGPKEARAWTYKKGSLAPACARVIHTDFEKGFIKAEIASYSDYIKYNGEVGTKNAGKLRIEGKDYIVEDGDVIHFRFNV